MYDKGAFDFYQIEIKTLILVGSLRPEYIHTVLEPKPEKAKMCQKWQLLNAMTIHTILFQPHGPDFGNNTKCIEYSVRLSLTRLRFT